MRRRVRSLGPRNMALRRGVPHQQEQRDRNTPEGDELGVGRGHAVALAVDAGGALLLNKALKGKVESLAGELARKHEGNLNLAGGEDEGGVDDAEGLGEEGEVGAEEGEVVAGVLEEKKDKN